MQKFAIAVHGGAGPSSEFIHNHQQEYLYGLSEARDLAFDILQKGGTAIEAVTAATISLEDNPFFNAGRGSAINNKGGIEMCASIMDGIDLSSGAATLIRDIKNPVLLARAVMEMNPHVYLGGPGAEGFAREIGLERKGFDYFKTEHQLEVYRQMLKTRQPTTTGHGTVGAVACDSSGNVAAATSTGGTEFKLEGRIGDSSIVGSGVYADNHTCAVSCTGDGEHIIKHVVAHDIAKLMEYKEFVLEHACSYLLNKLSDCKGDVGWIAVDAMANVSIKFNSERMHRAWRTSTGDSGAASYN